MRFDPGDGQVVMPADSGEKAPDSLNEGLVAVRFDGVVPEVADAVLTVCKEIDAPPGHSNGGPVSAANPSKSVVNCAMVCCLALLDGFDVLGLLPGFQNRVYAWNKGAGKVKQDRLNGLRGVGGNEDGGQRG